MLIKRYNEFIFENINDIESIIFDYEISNYSIKDGLVYVYEDVDIKLKELKNLNIKFAITDGSFFCNINQLTTLEGCPKIVNGNFNCSRNKLSSLEFCPIEVDGYFNCELNQITSLEGCPKIINGTFDCSNNRLTSLKYCPKFVNWEFHCPGNLLSIEDYPLCIIKQRITDILHFGEIFVIVKENEEIFENLLDDKIKFHQMIMCLAPNLIQYYKNIPPPSKKSRLLI